MIETSPPEVDAEVGYSVDEAKYCEQRRDAAEQTLLNAGWVYRDGADEWDLPPVEPAPIGGRDMVKAIIGQLKRENLKLSKQLRDVSKQSEARRRNLQALNRAVRVGKQRLEQLQAMFASAVVMEVPLKSPNQASMRCLLLGEADVAKVLAQDLRVDN